MSLSNAIIPALIFEPGGSNRLMKKFLISSLNSGNKLFIAILKLPKQSIVVDLGKNV